VKRGAASRYALASGAGALVAGLVVLFVAAPRGQVTLAAGLAAWLVTSLAGVAGGAWLVFRHGRPDSGFPLALAACMGLRLILFVAGPLAAAPLGSEAVWAVLGGLFAGYLPPQATEVLWFARGGASA